MLNYFVQKIRSAGVPSFELSQFEPSDFCFDADWYVYNYPDTPKNTGETAFQHYLRIGIPEKRNPNGFFREVFYCANNNDVRDAVSAGQFINGAYHFAHFGSREGRAPAPQLPFAHFGGAPARVKHKTRRRHRSELTRQLRKFLSGGRELAFECAESPKLSVVVVCFNQAAMTLACLQSLKAQQKCPIEVVVVDNDSDDDTAALLEKVSGITKIRNEQNLHFIAAANQGAESAKGEYLLFLNNDAVLRQGAAASAVEILDHDPSIGVLGGKIVFPDGSLQEYGAGVRLDGESFGIGRGECPSFALFQSSREPLYVSGCCLFTRRKLFESLSGFDEYFAPAYYEDVDYCMRAASAGERVVVDPRVSAEHFMSASSKSNRVRSALHKQGQERFIARYESQLSKLRFRGAKVLTTNCSRPRVLYLDDLIPIANRGAGYPRAIAVLRSLAELGCDVTVLPCKFEYLDWQLIYSDLPRNIRVCNGITVHAFLSYCERDLSEFDVIWVSRPAPMKFFQQSVRTSVKLKQGVRVIYDAEAIFSDRIYTREKFAPDKQILSLESEAVSAQDELRLVSGADEVVAVNELDAARFSGASKKPVHIVSSACIGNNGQSPSFAQRRDFLFVGAVAHPDAPNFDAAEWFISQVWPSILARIPNSRCVIAGNWTVEKPDFLDVSGVDFRGFQSDLTALYDSARVFIAPTRYSAGIPLKVLEAAANGVPTCISELLCEQLGWTADREALVAPTSDARAFAEMATLLYEDEARWQSVRRFALEKCAEDYSWPKFRSSVQRAVML